MLPASSDAQNIDLGQSSLSNIRTIKASHETSDAPDPSLTSTSDGDLTVPVFERMAESFTAPADSDKFDQLMADNSTISATPEYIGYLRETCGLDFGWGPSSVMQFLYEHIHISGEFGWTASIIILSTLLRLSMIPAMVLAQKESQKMKDLSPHMSPLREKYRNYLAEGNRVKAQEVGQEMRLLNKAANVRYSRMFGPLLIQFPFQFGAFRMLRASADLPVPAYVEQPWLWCADLSLSDPYYIAPALSAGLIYLQFTLSQKQQTVSPDSPMTPGMMKGMAKIIPAASFLFMFWQPGAVQLYFLTSSVLAVSTTWALRQTAVRSMISLPPLPGLGAPVLMAAGGVAGAAPAAKPKGGLRSRSDMLPEPVVQKAPEPERSAIDKGVDRLKSFSLPSMFNKSNSPKGSFRSSAIKKAETAQKETEKKRAKEFEKNHRRKLEIAREERNMKDIQS